MKVSQGDSQKLLLLEMEIMFHLVKYFLAKKVSIFCLLCVVAAAAAAVVLILVVAAVVLVAAAITVVVAAVVVFAVVPASVPIVAALEVLEV